MTEPPRSGWLEWLADSVTGVFDVETRPIQAGELVRLATDGALGLVTNREGVLLALRDGSLSLAHRWTEALLAKGANLHIPGTNRLRAADVALRLSVITRVWPGRDSYLYRVDEGSRDNAPGLRFLRELPITRSEVEADDQPVALIMHGFGSTTGGSHFEPLKRWLTDPRTNRYGLVLGFECDTIQRRIPDLADDLRNQLGRLGLLQGRRRIDLYTHSMGSIVARWLLENPEDQGSAGQERIAASVRRLIMAGPPNRGTRLAELGDRLMHLLERERRMPAQERGMAKLAFRLPLIGALALRLAPRVPAVRSLTQVLADMEPGSPFLDALQARARVSPDLPTYLLIQGVYDPVPPGESVPVRLLREAGTLVGDCDPRWSDLIVSTQSQAGIAPCHHSGAFLPEEQHLILRQTWHHQYWLDAEVFDRIRVALLDRMPR